MGCHFFHQEIFQTQKSNPGLLYCSQILYQLSCKVELGLLLLVGRAILKKFLSILSADGWVVFPSFLLFGLKHPRIEPEVCWVGPGLSAIMVDFLESSLSKYSLGLVPQVSFPPLPHPTESQCMLAFIPVIWRCARVTAPANSWNYGDSEQHQ